MSRSFILLFLLVGASIAWNYDMGYDSHPWNVKNVWVKRAEKSEKKDLPSPGARDRAGTVDYIHKRSHIFTLRKPPVRDSKEEIDLAVATPIHGCYITNWAVYRQEPYKFTPDRVPVGLCTHIFYAFAAINVATFEARMTDEWSDIGLGNFEKTQALKKTNPGMKTILSFGGWTESLSGIYNTMAADPVKRAKFIASAWKLANDNGFDGIDMDWEYPGVADRATFELKAASGGKLVTAAVSAGIEKIDAGYDVPAFEPYIDLLTVMTYDFHGSWENVVGHHAPFSGTTEALAHWASLGMPKSKLLIGIGAYGRGWIATPCAPGTVSTGIAPAQRITQEAGIAALFEMVTMNGVTIQTTDGPFLQATLNGQNACIGYDDRNAILRKMAFVKNEGYGGAFTWTIDFDDASFTVHNAIKDGLSGTSPSDPQSTAAPIGSRPVQTSTKSPSTRGHSSSSARPSPPAPTVSKSSPTVTSAPLAPATGPCVTGELRANSNAKKYEQCLFGSWLVRDCPAGTVFDALTKSFIIAP